MTKRFKLTVNGSSSAKGKFDGNYATTSSSYFRAPQTAYLSGQMFSSWAVLWYITQYTVDTHALFNDRVARHKERNSWSASLYSNAIVHVSSVFSFGMCTKQLIELSRRWAVGPLGRWAVDNFDFSIFCLGVLASVVLFDGS